MSTGIYDLLAREVGAAKVFRDEAHLETYARDESGLGSFRPDAVVLCDTREEVQAVLRLAAEARVPVTPRGAGTGMTGGALAYRGGVVLSTERMKKIRDVDERSLFAVVEPGCITGEIQEAVEKLGLFYPPDPASLAMCSIGGNVAENAGGPRAFKYGVTREWILGLEIVLMGGEALWTGKRTVKGVTGYDVVGTFVGSEGTLGVATEITLKLIGKPGGVATMLALYDTVAAAGDAVTAVIRRGYRPRTLELLDRPTVEHVRRKGTEFALPQDAGALLIVEIDGDPDSLDAEKLRVASLLEEVGAREVLVAQDEKERRNLWQARRIASPSLREQNRHKIGEDVVVPRGHIAELLRRVDAIGARRDVRFATFGHAGDGNLHVNLLTNDDLADPAAQARVDAALEDLFRETLALGGTLSGEHGIGLSKKKYISWEQPAPLIALQKRLKQALDPLGLMNPGKIFPD
jgi:glycolate oxidase